MSNVHNTFITFMALTKVAHQEMQAPSWERISQWTSGRILSLACPLDIQALQNTMPMLMSGIVIKIVNKMVANNITRE